MNFWSWHFSHIQCARTQFVVGWTFAFVFSDFDGRPILPMSIVVTVVVVVVRQQRVVVALVIFRQFSQWFGFNRDSPDRFPT